MNKNATRRPNPTPATPIANDEHHPRSSLVSRNVTVSGKRTSVRLEPEMWDGLREICQRERCSLHQTCTSIALQKLDQTSLTAAIRVFTMRYFRQAATDHGHSNAGHGFGLTLALGGNGDTSRSPASTMLVKDSFA